MTHKTPATAPMPHPAHAGEENPHPRGPQRDGAALQADFISLAAEMSWQLAVVVVVPIIGGYWLDGRYHHATPWLMFVGFGVAAIGVVGVMGRVLSEANRRSGNPPKGAA